MNNQIFYFDKFKEQKYKLWEGNFYFHKFNNLSKVWGRELCFPKYVHVRKFYEEIIASHNLLLLTGIVATNWNTLNNLYIKNEKIYYSQFNTLTTTPCF